ncbi:hypothetical protein [Mesorhizobium sp. CN2-181]|uniref:hypothetical protein n=1 Tax=Mesorhizobium yinganensis TaxID=3157707 RepID=UPI0032B79983
MENLIKAVKSLLSDIEGMNCRAPDYAENQSNYWFGRFSEFDNSLESLDGMAVEWPNLAISADEVKKALDEYEFGTIALLKTIEARIQGVWDHPGLQQLGALGTVEQDIARMLEEPTKSAIVKAVIESAGDG